ncbi:MAG: hypothetical protein WCY97_01675 [Methanothrix sp.]|nr:hypothetical protein [Methanothrix harundinacea]MDD2639141.1 hypothetical protein [Methanothrix sp.]MDD3709426.1 hypothetical protein [Methanothrix sp.]MDD5767982.1 hypothetical protein [Methanothrix sp.]MDI9398826.1 hypothetical protein [Euryarchaeota archaeon]
MISHHLAKLVPVSVQKRSSLERHHPTTILTANKSRANYAVVSDDLSPTLAGVGIEDRGRTSDRI